MTKELFFVSSAKEDEGLRFATKVFFMEVEKSHEVDVGGDVATLVCCVTTEAFPNKDIVT